MAFLSSLDIAGSALTAERLRMDIIAQNIANAKVTSTEDGEPYRRQLVKFGESKSFSDELQSAKESYLASANQTSIGTRRAKNSILGDAPAAKYEGVVVTEVVEDQTELTPVYDPDHPDADEDGYVWYPNVDTAEEEIDLMAATRSYEANLTVVEAVKSMASKALQIGR